MKIGIHLPSLRLPVDKAVALAAQLGADAVEVDARWQLKPSEMSQTAIRQFRKMLDDQRLRVCAVSYRTRRGYDELDELDRRVAGTKQAMQLAHALGAQVVVNHVGQIPSEPEGPKWNLLVQVLTDLGQFGHRAGALLAAQTGNQSGADVARLLAALPDGSIAVDLDPGRMIENGFSPLEAIEALAPHILHVHATDGVFDRNRGRGQEVPLGRGSVDFPALLGALEERGYRGYFTIQRDRIEDAEDEIGAAVQYLRRL